MGKKQLCALFLVFAMLFSMGQTMIPAVRAANGSPGTQQDLSIQYSTDPGSLVSKDFPLTISQSGAWNLTIKATVANSNNVFVVLLGAHLYDGHFDQTNTITTINAANYNTKDDVLRPIDANYKNYYKTQMTSATIGTEATLFNQKLTEFSVTETSAAYHQKYVALIFDQNHNLEEMNDYTIVSFYINKDGFLQTDSYLLRYQSNHRPTGGNDNNGASKVSALPGSSIIAWKANAPVTTDQPKRTGYTFLGWDSDKAKMSTDPNTASGQTGASVGVEFPAGGSDQAVTWAKASQKFGTETFDGASDKIYDLYALWQPNRVQFKTGIPIQKDTATVTINGQTRQQVPVMELPAPRVGQSYAYTLDLGGTTDAATGKAFNRYSTASIALNSGGTVNASNLTDYFDSLSQTAPTTMSTRLAGTPKQDRATPLYFLVEVKDNVNLTTDWLVIKFPEIKKGAQPVPSMDDNTGLETQVEEEDGQIFGFYSGGPTLAESYGDTIQADSTNGYFDKDTASPAITGINGTGTMTNYYLRYGMVFEYRPKVINGETVSYDKATEPEEPEVTKPGDDTQTTDETGGADEGEEPVKPAKTYADMPNEGWREIPLPQSWYKDATAKANMEASLGTAAAAATKVIYSTGTPTVSNNVVTGGNAVVQDKTPAGFDGWLSSYGYIAFNEAGLPEIHGLAENDEYEVRFRASTIRDASAAQTVKIGGAVAGGGGSGGVSVNLAGGSIAGEDAEAYVAFVNACAALQTGGTVTLPKFKPIRENYAFLGWKLGNGNGTTELVYQPEAEVSIESTPISISAVWNSTTAGFASIVFYDWDETYLGAAIISKTASSKDIDSAIATFVKSKYSGYTSDMTLPEDLSEESYKDDATMPLTYKKGYNFAGWVEVNSTNTLPLADAFTAYASMGEADEDGNYPAETFNADKFTAGATPESGWTGFTLKAAYVENAHCNEGSGGYYYSSTQSTYDRPGSASAGNFAIQFSVSRENTAGKGVTRLRMPAVRIVMKAGQNQFLLLQYIDKTDTATVEVIAPKTIDSVMITLIDASSSWVGAGQQAVDKNESTSNYVKEGTLTFINSAGIAAAKTPVGETLPASWRSDFDYVSCSDAGLKYKGANVTARNMTTVRNNLLKAFQAFVSDENNTGKTMSFNEIQTGIDTGTWIPSE